MPSEVGPLRDKLMQIEKVIGNQPLAASNSTATKEKSGGGTKRSAEKEPKKSFKKQKGASGFSKKNCQLCAKHGGTERTHNTKDCRKYDADGNLQKSFHSKRNDGNSHSKLKSLTTTKKSTILRLSVRD